VSQVMCNTLTVDPSPHKTILWVTLTVGFCWWFFIFLPLFVLQGKFG